MYSVYIHINKVNGKRYVGITCREPERRWGYKGYGYRQQELFYRAIQRDDGICALCGSVVNRDDYIMDGDTYIVNSGYPSIDHIVPVSKGGTHTWDNVQLAHRICNSKKSASYEDI